jgi:SAM-dependent methyltransferase
MDYDAELRFHNEALRRAAAIAHDEHVLDIGCGTGQTTREAARVAAAGSALGVDSSAAMIARARELAAAEGLPNVYFVQDDAQVHGFTTERYHAAISRFGTMFFANPVAAFRNIGRALRPNGRLVMMVWQQHELNEWSVMIQRSLAPGTRAPAPSAGTPDAFSLADPTAVARILTNAGFVGTSFKDVREPVYYGPSVAAALGWIRGFSCTQDLLRRLDAVAAERAVERLREALAERYKERGVWFASRAWIVTANRTGRR